MVKNGDIPSDHESRRRGSAPPFPGRDTGVSPQNVAGDGEHDGFWSRVDDLLTEDFSGSEAHDESESPVRAERPSRLEPSAGRRRAEGPWEEFAVGEVLSKGPFAASNSPSLRLRPLATIGQAIEYDTRCLLAPPPRPIEVSLKVADRDRFVIPLLGASDVLEHSTVADGSGLAGVAGNADVMATMGSAGPAVRGEVGAQATPMGSAGVEYVLSPTGGIATATNAIRSVADRYGRAAGATAVSLAVVVGLGLAITQGGGGAVETPNRDEALLVGSPADQAQEAVVAAPASADDAPTIAAVEPSDESTDDPSPAAVAPAADAPAAPAPTVAAADGEADPAPAADEIAPTGDAPTDSAPASAPVPDAVDPTPAVTTPTGVSEAGMTLLTSVALSGAESGGSAAADDGAAADPGSASDAGSGSDPGSGTDPGSGLWFWY